MLDLCLTRAHLLSTGIQGCSGTELETGTIFDWESGDQAGYIAREYGEAQFWV